MKRNQFLLTGAIVQFALLLPVAWWARKHPHPPSEVAISRLVQKKQRSFMRSFVTILNTLTGSAVFLNILVVPIAVVLWKMRLRLEAVMIIATSWTSILVRAGIKQVVHRPRPNPLLVHVTHPHTSKSFPSGHVTAAVVVWGWLFALGLFTRKESQPGRSLQLSIPVVFVIFTGPARIYLGEHWATDVLGGYLFGGGWLSLWLYFYLRLRAQGTLPGVQMWDERSKSSFRAPHTPDKVHHTR